MSSSDDLDLPFRPEETSSSETEAWGTVFTPHGEKNLKAIERTANIQWTREEVEDYLARVRERATEMAEKIVNDAKALREKARAEAATLVENTQQSILAQGEEARKEGYEAGHAEGYAKGEAEANAELEQLRSGMADSVSAVLSAIEGQCSQIFTRWREDILEVGLLAIEKMTAAHVSEARAETLANLFTGAVKTLERSSSFTIVVNPEDEPVINDIVGATKEKYPDVVRWNVKSDAAISPGGLVVETESSLAASLAESRQAAVETILSGLSLPAEP